MTLFEKLKDNQIWDAQIVGKNKFCKNPQNIEVFCKYFDFCISVSKFPVEIETRNFFANEAELALRIFCEQTDIDEDILTLIQSKRHDLVHASNSINDAVQISNRKNIELIKERNNANLKELAKYKSQICETKTQCDFDKCLAQIVVIENNLNKEYFSESQASVYTELTKDYSAVVSSKMDRFAHLQDVEYNKCAVRDFKSAFETFKKDPDAYKQHDAKLYELVSKYLFTYDAKRLFNESLIYFNHVYSYIFNKLDDDGKFRFTQLSFDVVKRDK